jgi:hypothetical protein
MKALSIGLLLWLVSQVAVVAQESDRSLERIALALRQPHPVIHGLGAVEPSGPRKLGILTLVPPGLQGEIVRVSVPIGELVTRAFRGVAAAKQRRQEEAARQRVEAALDWFAAHQPSSRK